MGGGAQENDVAETPALETLLSDARRIGAVAGERRLATHERRDTDPEVIGQLREAGLMRMLQPKAFGGYEMDVRDFLAVQNVLAETCVSTGWVYGVLAIQAYFIALFGREAQHDLWAEDPSTLICSSGFPRGNVTVFEGGYRLSGQWPYSSGSSHAQWAVIGALVPPPDPEGKPQMRQFLVPQSDYEIVDTWRTFGLRGTGSNDLRLDNTFVPEHRTWKQTDGNLGHDREDLAPMYRMPWLYVVPSVVSNLAVGAGRGAVKTFLASRMRAATFPTPQEIEDLAVAGAHLEIEGANALVGQHIAAMLAYAERCEPVPTGELALYRRHQQGMLRAITAKVEELMLLTGARGISDDGPLTRIWLDLCAARHHVGNSPSSAGLNLAMGLKAAKSA
jgi:3-hydroxy-9,10-secoandrosta-1,3,5(10)-triene-9,17-dione monooxygenase